MKRVATGIATACVAVASIVGGGGLVEAGSAADHDAKNDVWVYDWDEDELDQGWWNPDIAGVRVVHSWNRVRAVVKFHRLRKLFGFGDELIVYIDGDRDRRVDYRFEIDRFEPDFTGVFVGRWSFRKVCDLRWNVNWATKSVSMSAPRRCVGRPGRVRVWAEFWEQWSSVPGSDCCLNWSNDDTDWTAKARRG